MAYVQRRTKEQQIDKAKIELSPNAGEFDEKELKWGRFYLDEYEKNRPELSSFKKSISDVDRQRDANRVKQLELERGYGQGSLRPKFLEAFLASTEAGENWFEMLVQETTRYDDYENGVDTVWEWPGKGEVIRLAIDVTTNSDPAALYEKLNRIHANVQAAKLGTVKYFRSQVAGSREEGPIDQLPHVVIGTDGEGMQRLAKAYAGAVDIRQQLAEFDEQMGKKRLTPGETIQRQGLEKALTKEMKAIESDPLPLMILEQIRMQLGTQLADAVASFFKDRDSVVGAFPDQRVPEAFEAVYQDLKTILNKGRKGEELTDARAQLIASVGQALPTLKEKSSKYGGAIEALHKTLTFVEALVTKKQEGREGALSALPDAHRPLNQVLSAPWSPYVRRDMPDLRTGR